MSIFSAQDKARGQTRKLLLLFALTVIALVLAVNAGLALMWWPLMRFGLGYPEYFFEVNTVLTLGFVLGGWWIESSNLSQGGAKLARRVGARELWDSRKLESGLDNLLQELLIASKMQAPQLMVLDREEGINAFAAGWDEDDAVIAVTRGALEQLTREELQGMLAHELAHIREGDTRLNMRLSGMVYGLEMVFNFGAHLCEPDDDGKRTAKSIPGAVIMGVGSLGWLAGRWLRAAVSRQREFLADARALQYTRSKEGLGGALRKAQSMALAGHNNLRFAHPAVQHMWLLGAASDSPNGPVAQHTHWADNHPPIAERIRRIYGRHMPPLPAPRASAAYFPD